MNDRDLSIPEDLEPWVRLGTCSWKFDSWEGIVYAPGPKTARGNYLGEYSRVFDTVEVDQWFWSLFPGGPKLPDRRTARDYADSVPEGFLFAVKAPNSVTLTHFYKRQPKAYAHVANQPNPHFLDTDLFCRFLDRLEPLGDKLGPVMLQFEYLNRQKMPSAAAFAARLGAFFAELPDGVQVAVETRNKNYLTNALFDVLRQHGAGYVFCEGYYMPPLGEVAARHDTATANVAIIRLLGPDRKAIEDKTDHDWNTVVEPRPDRLEQTASILRANAARGIVTLVYANNHFEGSAPLTLDRLAALLRRADD